MAGCRALGEAFQCGCRLPVARSKLGLVASSPAAARALAGRLAGLGFAAKDQIRNLGVDFAGGKRVRA